MPASYLTISAAEAHFLMESGEPMTILDVREQSEYQAGHIKNALLMPLGTVELAAPSRLPDKEQTILVYCQSGRRSAVAAGMLCELGYTDVLNFGGICDWPFAIVQ